MGEFADKLAGEKLFCQRAYLGSLLPNYIKSGNLGKYYEKLTDFNFLMAKIQHPEFGVQALIDDFNLVDDSEALTHPEYDPQKAKALNLIQALLWMSADILERDKTQLAEQLWGRLVHSTTPEIQAMLEVAKQCKATPWFRPLTPCFTPPGRGLIRTLKGHTNSVNAVAVTADGKRAISGSFDNTLKVWDLTTGEKQFTLTGHSNSVNAVAVTADGKIVISGSDDNTLKVWDLTTRKEKFTLTGHRRSVNIVAVTADGKQAISGSSDETIKVWDLTTGKEDFIFTGHRGYVTTLAVSVHGKWAIGLSRRKLILVTLKNDIYLNGDFEVVTSDEPGYNPLKVWDLTTGKELFHLYGHGDRVINAVAVTADGKRVIAAWDDNTLKIWDLTTEEQLFYLKGHTNSVNAVAVTADGKRAISASDDNTLKVWDLTTRKELFFHEDHRNSVNAVAVTADGKRAISASDDHTLKIWDLTTGKELFRLYDHRDCVKAVAITADGNRAISASDDNTIKVWDLTTKKELFTIQDFHFCRNWVEKLCHKLKFHVSSFLASDSLNLWSIYNTVVGTANGKRAIFYSQDKTIKVLDLTTRKEQFTFTGHSSLPSAVVATADGKRVIFSSLDNTIKVWDLTIGEEQFTFKDHSDSVRIVAVTADGKRVIYGSDDNTLKVWDWSNGNVIASFTGESPIACGAIAPDGVTIVAGDESGRVYFLRLEGVEALT